MKTSRLVAFCLFVCLAAAWAQAAPGKAKTNPVKETAAFQTAVLKLQSPNPAEVLESVMILGASGNPRAVGPLSDLLKTGPRDDISNAAVDALGSLGDPSGLDTLLSFLSHRRADLRERVIMAIMDMKDPRVDGAIENALRDSDVGVRNAAAMAIGNRGQTQSIPILFQAFERGVSEAAIAIGRLGDEGSAQRLVAFLGKRDLMEILPGLDEFLRREDFPAKGKLDILDSLLDLAGPEVKRFLIAYVSTFTEEQKRDKVKLKVEEIIRAIPDQE